MTFQATDKQQVAHLPSAILVDARARFNPANDIMRTPRIVFGFERAMGLATPAKPAGGGQGSADGQEEEPSGERKTPRVQCKQSRRGLARVKQGTLQATK